MSTSVSMAIINKGLKISLLSNKNFKTGELVNMLQTDTFKLEQAPF